MCPPVLLRHRRPAVRGLAGATALLLVVSASVVSTAVAAQPPALAFEADAVVVSGLPPHGEVLLFSVAREPRGYFSRVVRRAEVVRANSDGEALYRPSDDGSELPPRALWVAVDLASGALATEPTPGFPHLERAVPPNAVRRGLDGRLNRIADGLEEADLLVVRPGAAGAWGAWHRYLADGGAFDLDTGEDGALEGALADLEPLAASPAAPEELAQGDVVVLIDPGSLTFFAVRLKP